MNDRERNDHGEPTPMDPIDTNKPTEPGASQPIRISRGEDEGVPLRETYAPVEEEKPLWNPLGQRRRKKRQTPRRPRGRKVEEPSPKPEPASGSTERVEGKASAVGADEQARQSTPGEVTPEGRPREVELVLEDDRKPPKKRRPKPKRRKHRSKKPSRIPRQTQGILVGVLVLALLIGLLFFRGRKPRKGRTLAVQKSVYCTTEQMQSVKYTDQGLRFWDLNSLAWYSPTGEEQWLVENPDLGRVFFLGDRIYAVNHLTQDTTVLDANGEQVGYISGGGYNVVTMGEAGDYRVMHRRTPDGELLSLMKDDQELTPLFSTGEFILSYDVENPNHFIVATMVTREQGYRSRIVRAEGENIRNYDFDNEVVMKVFLKGNDVYAVTNQNLYWLRNEERKAVPIALFKNAQWDGNTLWILHGDVLESFNRQLKSLSKVVPAVPAVSFLRHDGTNYVYSATEIAGYGDQEETPSLYYRTDFTIRELQMAGDTLAIVYGDHTDLTKVVAAQEQPMAPSDSEEPEAPTTQENPLEDGASTEEGAPSEGTQAAPDEASPEEPVEEGRDEE